MKSIKKMAGRVLRSFSVVGLLVIVCTTNLFAMRMKQGQIQRVQKSVKSAVENSEQYEKIKQQLAKQQSVKMFEFASDKEREQRLGKFFIQEEDTNEGFGIDLAELQSKSAMINRDRGEEVILKSISVPFPIDVVKLVFGIPGASPLRLDQLKEVIDCIKFFQIKYVENDETLEPSKALLDFFCACITAIGEKFINLLDEITKNCSSNKNCSMNYYEQNVPDYHVFQNITNPVLEKAILGNLIYEGKLRFSNNKIKRGSNLVDLVANRKIPHNICDRFIEAKNKAMDAYFVLTSEKKTYPSRWEFDAKYGYLGYDMSIMRILNYWNDTCKYWVNKYVEYYKEEQAKKWFWQRW